MARATVLEQHSGPDLILQNIYKEPCNQIVKNTIMPPLEYSPPQYKCRVNVAQNLGKTLKMSLIFLSFFSNMTYTADLSELSYITTKPHSFKDPNRIKAHNRRFKPARQLLSDEIKYLQSKTNLKFDTPTSLSIAAPPTLTPSKKYCDVTGLPGPYRSPSNNLRFHDAEIYQEVIKHMPPGLDQEYLSLRGANVILK